MKIWLIVVLLGLSAAFALTALALWQPLKDPAPDIEHPSLPPAPHQIVADLRFADGREEIQVMQECIVAWKEGSATELERVCSDRVFPSRADAEATLAEAQAALLAADEKRRELAAIRVYVRPVEWLEMPKQQAQAKDTP